MTYPMSLAGSWLLAIPHYLVLAALAAGATYAFLGGFCAVLVTGEYPQGIPDYLAAVFGCGLRVEAYARLLTDTYPPFGLTAGDRIRQVTLTIPRHRSHRRRREDPGRWLALLMTNGA